ncbi:hypothetical protein [Pimelobacter simplex]|uniref:hypothetical protein n=1 Tax=Nocardioides simplex TaxID=2045 RepID=UPI001932F84D|nr:hypothetical protein [Pimelobacter simplex]
MPGKEPWGESDRLKFAAAMRAAGHDEEQCAAVLRKDFGVENASQPNVNRWKSGATKRPGPIEPLRAYTERYGEPVEQPADTSSPPNASAFAALAGLAADQPLLGPEQQQLVSAVTERLRHGPPLSKHDYRAFELQALLLGLPAPNAKDV